MKKRKAAVSVAGSKTKWHEIMRECRGIVLKKSPGVQKNGLIRVDNAGILLTEAKACSGGKQ